MMKKYLLSISLMIIAALVLTSCTTSTSVGGASIETGSAIDSDFEIVSPSSTFPPGEEFYFSFFNYDDFNSNIVTLRLTDTSNDEIMLEYEYDVNPEWNIMADAIWFSDPGKYKISLIINGQVRATQEVIIE